MKILVCISNVPDTTTKIRFTGDGKSLDSAGVQWIINPWDELALTRAVELKEGGAGVDNVTVVTVGNQASEATLRKALAIGADNAIRVNLDAGDAYQVAVNIAAAVKDGGFDIVLAGIESSDYNGSQVGGMVAEALDIPSVSGVSNLNIEGSNLKVTREIEGGTELVSLPAPALFIVQKGITKEPRIPAMRGIMMARSKPLQVVEASGDGALTSYESYSLPSARAACRMIDKENPGELVDLLHNEAKLI